MVMRPRQTERDGTRKALLIFIDSFPFCQLADAPFLSSLLVRLRVTPGCGFSVNLLPELFSGRRPDAVGFFNEWTVGTPSVPPGVRGLLWRLLASPFGAALEVTGDLHPLASLVVHKGVQRLFGLRVANIPFDDLHLFVERHRSPFNGDFPSPTLFSERPDLSVVRNETYRAPYGRRDQLAVEEAQYRISRGESVLVALGDLDHIAHQHGVRSRAYREMLKTLDGWCSQLAKEFHSLHGPQAPVCIFSDHGMADVHTPITLPLKRLFGPQQRGQYAFFLDAVMLRVWCWDRRLGPVIQQYLSGLPYGRLLSQQDRRRFGVTRRDFGDFIFILEEGYAFVPNFYGGRMIKAMHGYHPDCERQQAIFLCSCPLPPDLHPGDTTEVYGALNWLLQPEPVPGPVSLQTARREVPPRAGQG